MILERIELERVDWERLDTFPDRLVFQSREWVEFIAATQGAEPLLAELREGSEVVGCFTGLLVRRYGLTILGSPLPGWTTPFLGFNLDQGVSGRAAIDALLELAFESLRCAHLEIKDRNLRLEDVAGLGFDHTPWKGIEVDLRRSEDEIFAGFKGPCRTAIRKAKKGGVVVEEADDLGFADDYHAQLKDVFAKQSLVPPYGVERIRSLIRHLHPSGQLLLLRARGPDGSCIATGIFPAAGRTMHFLGGASWRDAQHLRPNEAVMWHAMRRWKQFGIEACDLGGYMSYKTKYGGREVELPFLRRSRSRGVATMRGLAQAAFNARQRLHGMLRRS